MTNFGTNFEYDDGSARSGAQQFEQLGADLGALAASMDGELSGDSPWSHDKIGSSFGSGFDPQRSAAIANIKDLAEKVQSYGPVITDAANAIVTEDGRGSTR